MWLLGMCPSTIYPKGVSDNVTEFHHQSNIQFTEEEEVELIKFVASYLPGKLTVAFGILFYGPKSPRKDLRLHVDADFTAEGPGGPP